MSKKTFFIVIALIFALLLFFCGCTQNIDKKSESKTVDWNAQNMADDLDFSMKVSEGNMSWEMGFKSLNEGDKLILTDEILNMTYTQFMYNATQISFSVEEYNTMGINSSEIVFLFEGNITGQYNIGNNVKITLTIENYKIGNETTGNSIELEGYKEGSMPGENLLTFFTQILPKTCIEKA